MPCIHRVCTLCMPYTRPVYIQAAHTISGAESQWKGFDRSTPPLKASNMSHLYAHPVSCRQMHTIPVTCRHFEDSHNNSISKWPCPANATCWVYIAASLPLAASLLRSWPGSFHLALLGDSLMESASESVAVSQ